MSYITIEDFLNQNKIRNTYVEHPDFQCLYVRHGHHLINGEIVATFDIVRVEAKQPGKGAFSRLLNSLNVDKPIYVESVINERFAQWLLRNGFTHNALFECDYFRV